MEISRRRVLAGAAVAASGSALLAGCGQSAGSVPGRMRIVTPEFAGNEGRDAFEGQILGSFDNDVAISVDYTAWDKLNEKLTTGIASGVIPDMIMMGVGWVPPFASKGVFSELPAGLFDQVGVNDSLRPMCEYDGRVHGLPYVTDGRMLNANRTMLADVGILEPPGDLVELREMCRELQDVVVMPIDLFSENIRQAWIHFVAAFGGTLFSEDGREIAFTDGSGAAALQYMVDLMEDGSSDFRRRGTPGQPRPFQRQEAAIELIGTGSWGNVSTQSPELYTDPERTELFLLPGERGQDPVLYIGGTLVSVSEQSPNRDASLALVEHMFGPDMIMIGARATGKVPPVDDLPPDEQFESNRLAAFTADNLEYSGAFEGGSAAWMEIREQVQPQLEATLGGGQSVEDTIANLERISQIALDRLT